jgi:hypothetical protein
MKRLAAGAVVLLLGLGGALFFFRGDAPLLPEGFSSIREAPAFQDPKLLARAWALPVASTFSRPILSQTNPSSCGPASVANVLRSAGAPMSADDVAAHGSGCVAGFCFGGLTLTQLGEATREAAPGWKVTELHPETLEKFREELRRKEGRLIINFHRRPLFGAGGGHHSPIGGYLEKEDLVFVLDVNERFGPWLVSSERLFGAMDTMDGSSKRGLLRLCQELLISESVGATLDDADLVVEPLDESERHLVLGLAVSGDTVPVAVDHLGELLVGIEALPLERRPPVLEEPTSPAFLLVAHMNATHYGRPDYYWKIMLPGALVGAIVGYVVMRYGKAPQRTAA